MIVLGIESATESVGVALAASDGVLASVEVARGRRHAESIVPCVQFVCERADIELSEVGAIAVDVGPGLFTGMRVGIATAKSLAMALNIPMVPMTSLEVLAAAEATTDDIIVPVVDARKSEVFWAMYRRTHQGLELLHQPTVGSVDDLVSDLMARDQSRCVSAMGPTATVMTSQPDSVARLVLRCTHQLRCWRVRQFFGRFVMRRLQSRWLSRCTFASPMPRSIGARAR